MDEEFANNLEDNIEEVPQEVRDFVFGPDFKIIKNQLLQNIDKEEEKIEFSNMLMFFLLESKTAEEFDMYIQSLSITPEKKDSIRKSIKENIIDEILLLIEVNQELDQEAASPKQLIPTNDISAKTTNLTALANRLKQSSLSTTTTRNYGMEKGIVPDNLPTVEPSTTPAPSIDTPPVPVQQSEEPVITPAQPIHQSFDPYHEPIDK